MKHAKPLIVVAALALATGAAVPTFAASGNKYADQTSQQTCDDGTVTLVGPLKLWPPNHKMVDEPVTAKANDSANQVTLTITPTVTDAVGGDGGEQHNPDFNSNTEDGKSLVASGQGEATAGLQLRAERSGKGEGRTYTIDWLVDWGNGSSCSSDDGEHTPFVVTVPHDMRGGADWK